MQFLLLFLISKTYYYLVFIKEHKISEILYLNIKLTKK